MKIGDVLRPTDNLTGYCQIYKIEDIPDHRLGYYNNDNIVNGRNDKLYHVYTDFGSNVVYTYQELCDHYEVAGNEDVRQRMIRWRDNVCAFVSEWEVKGE